MKDRTDSHISLTMIAPPPTPKNPENTPVKDPMCLMLIKN